MTLQPNFLPVGSIVQRNGIPCTVQIASNDSISTNLSSGLLKEFSGIQLTPEILTEWCGLTKVNRHNDKNMCAFCFGDLEVLISVDNCATFLNAFTDIQLDYLHELQLLFLGMKQVLPITIK